MDNNLKLKLLNLMFHPSTPQNEAINAFIKLHGNTSITEVKNILLNVNTKEENKPKSNVNYTEVEIIQLNIEKDYLPNPMILSNNDKQEFKKLFNNSEIRNNIEFIQLYGRIINVNKSKMFYITKISIRLIKYKKHSDIEFMRHAIFRIKFFYENFLDRSIKNCLAKTIASMKLFCCNEISFQKFEQII